MTATTAAPESRGLDRGLLTVAAVVVLGAVMSILDTTVVNVAIPTLAKDFSTPLTTIQWVVTGYTLALATVIPITGWAADRFGTKRLYLLSIALFLAGSLLRRLWPPLRAGRRRSTGVGRPRASAPPARRAPTLAPWRP